MRRAGHRVRRPGILCMSGSGGAGVAGEAAVSRARGGGRAASAAELPAIEKDLHARLRSRWAPHSTAQREATSSNFTTFVSHSLGQPPFAPTMRPSVPPWSWPRVLSQFGWAGPGSLMGDHDVHRAVLFIAGRELVDADVEEAVVEGLHPEVRELEIPGLALRDERNPNQERLVGRDLPVALVVVDRGITTRRRRASAGRDPGTGSASSPDTSWST